MPKNAARRRLAVCIDNAGNEGALEFRQVYEVLPETKNAGGELIRVIDESGEDYLYPAAMFRAIELPEGGCRRYVAEVPEPTT